MIIKRYLEEYIYIYIRHKNILLKDFMWDNIEAFIYLLRLSDTIHPGLPCDAPYAVVFCSR